MALMRLDSENDSDAGRTVEILGDDLDRAFTGWKDFFDLV